MEHVCEWIKTLTSTALWCSIGRKQQEENKCECVCICVQVCDWFTIMYHHENILAFTSKESANDCLKWLTAASLPGSGNPVKITAKIKLTNSMQPWNRWKRIQEHFLVFYDDVFRSVFSGLFSENEGEWFSQTLKSVVQKGGINTTTKEEKIKFNMDLSLPSVKHDAELFSKTFP